MGSAGMNTPLKDGPRGPIRMQDVTDLAFLVVCFVLCVSLLPIILPMMLVFRIYRRVTVAMIKRKYGNDVIPCDGKDSVWLQETPENPGIIKAVLQMRGNPDPEVFKRVIEDRLVNSMDPDQPGQRLLPTVTKYPTKILHRYVWMEEEHFDIADHVYLYPESAASDKAALERLVSTICSKPFPAKKAPWEFILVQDMDQTSEVYHVVFRVHHALADGMSLMRMVMQLLVDEKPTSLPVRFSTKGNFKRALRAIFEGPGLLAEKFLWNEERHALHGPKVTGDKLATWSDPVSLELIKKIKNATGTTVNDVLMSCLAGAMRDYFKRHADRIPPHIQCYIPVDLRSLAGKVSLDNQFALVFMALPLDRENDLDILQETKSRMDRIKSTSEPIVNSLIIRYSMNRLPNWLTSWFFAWFSRKCSLVLSNVPGPQQKLTIAGQSVDSLVFWPPQKENVGKSL